MKHPDAETTLKVPEEYRPLLEDLRQLTKDGQNPNKMTKSRREGLWRSLQKFGWVYPILASREGMLGDGEQRIEACLSHDEYYGPVLRLDIEEVDRRLLRQITNKLKGSHDLKLDKQEYTRIIEAGRRKDLISILQLREKDLLDAIQKTDGEDTPDIMDVETDIKLGDIYVLGAHRLMCGDATNPSHLNAILDGAKLDCILTDPPYGIDVVSRGGKIGGDKEFGSKEHRQLKNAAQIGFSRKAKAKFYMPVIGDDKPFDPTHLLDLAPIQLLFGANYYSSKLPDSPGWMVWDKNAGRDWSDTFADAELIYTNSKRHSKIYRVLWKGMIKDPDEGPRIHPTQKPVKLIKMLLADFTELGHKVGDLYGGSGSTLIACEVLDRSCFLMEIVPEYCQLIIDRWEAYTGEKAAKIEVTP